MWSVKLDPSMSESVVANVGRPAELQPAADRGADGVGLYRTEFLFLDRESPPSEDEQYEAITEALDTFPDSRVVVRTLDVGGDKRIPYLDLPADENPFLGERGIHRSLGPDSDLFATQLRAATASAGDLNVMFPLVATVEELEAAIDAVDDAAAAAVDETTVQQRAAWCSAIAAGLRERRSELADSLVREAGKPSTSARAEVDHAAERFEYVVAELRELSGEYRTWTAANRTEWNALVKVAPLGVVVCRPDAESPLGSAVLQVAPALAAGNSVVLQPAKTTPVAASVLTHIIASTDVPAAGFAFVPEPTSVASKALSTHDAVAAAEELQGQGFESVVASLGADGAVLVSPATTALEPPIECEVVDTVGAGDALLAGFLAALDTGKSEATALETGVVTATEAVQTVGTTVPSLPSVGTPNGASPHS